LPFYTPGGRDPKTELKPTHITYNKATCFQGQAVRNTKRKHTFNYK